MQEKQIESYDSHLANSIKGLFLPSWLEAVLYILSAAVVLCILNYNILLNSVSSSSNVSQNDLSNYLHVKLSAVGNFSGSLFQGRLATMLFWAFIGSLIYMIVWTIQNLIINLRNDVKAGEFVSVHDQTDRRRAYWSSVISSKVFFVCSLLALIIYIASLDRFFFPVTSRSFGLALTHFRFPGSLLNLAFAIAITTILLFCLTLLARVVVRSWRWIIGNF